MKTTKPIRKKPVTRRGKVTVSLPRPVYDRLQALAGRRSVSRFLETVVAPRRTRAELETGYRAAAMDSVSEAEAREWAEVTVGDVADEPR